MIENNVNGNIITDSKNSIIRLYSIRTNSLVITQIQKDLDINKGKIKVMWVGELEELSEHRIGIRKADTEAKLARSLEASEISGDIKSEIKELKNKMVHIKWQNQWNGAVAGRLTYKLIEEIGYDIIGLSSKGIQLVTGHGNMKGYLKRFKLKETDGRCQCCGVDEDANHLLFECELLDRQRDRMMQGLNVQRGDIRLRKDGEGDVCVIEAINDFAESAIRDLNYEQNIN